MTRSQPQSVEEIARSLTEAKKLLSEAFDEMTIDEGWIRRARALGVKGNPCGYFELKARNALADDWAACGWVYQQGFVAGRDGKRRDSNPHRARPRRLWDEGWVAGRTASPACSARPSGVASLTRS